MVENKKIVQKDLGMYKSPNQEKLPAQLSESSELTKIITKIIKQKPVNFLVFGVGNDSSYWININKGGRTVFIEDSPDWLEKIKTQDPRIEAYLVNYNSNILEWEKLLNRPDLLAMDLPNKVTNTKWDVILVDAPEGWHDNCPGRMKSIYLSSKLIKIGGHVFVHDCHRKVERVCCDKYLLKKNLVEEILNLRHYHIKKNWFIRLKRLMKS